MVIIELFNCLLLFSWFQRHLKYGQMRKCIEIMTKSLGLHGPTCFTTLTCMGWCGVESMWDRHSDKNVCIVYCFAWFASICFVCFCLLPTAIISFCAIFVPWGNAPKGFSIKFNGHCWAKNNIHIKNKLHIKCILVVPNRRQSLLPFQLSVSDTKWRGPIGTEHRQKGKTRETKNAGFWDAGWLWRITTRSWEWRKMPRRRRSRKPTGINPSVTFYRHSWNIEQT